MTMVELKSPRRQRTAFTVRSAIARAAAVIVCLLAAVAADAGTIKISDGFSTLIITDQDFTTDDGTPADLSDQPGVVSFMGVLGSWTFNMTSGITKPALGSSTAPVMELHDISLSSSTTGGTLTIWFSEVGFGPTAPVAETVIGGVAEGKIKFETFKGVALFEESQALSSSTFNSGYFGGTESVALGNSDGPYSLTQKVTITHKAGAKVSSFHAIISASPAAVPDGGATLSLLGLGLVGVAFLRQRLSARN